MVGLLSTGASGNRGAFAILLAVIGALVAGLAGTFIQGQVTSVYPTAPYYATITLVVILVGAAIYAGVQFFARTVLAARFAVLLFVLDPENRLLVIVHPFHRRLQPPGGRLDPRETPEHAVYRTLQEETGLHGGQVTFEPAFHPALKHFSDKVEEEPRPYSVHREYRTQRGSVRSHVALVYVLRATGSEAPTPPPIEGYSPSWRRLTELEALSSNLRPFDDIMEQYRRVLTRISSCDVSPKVGIA